MTTEPAKYQYAPDTWLLLLNPVSGGGRGLRQRTRIESAMAARHLSAHTAVSEYAGHTTELVARAIRAGCRRLLVGGGDGSLSEAVNGILAVAEVPSTDVTLALLPVGTGNDWARGHGIPHDIDRALDIVAAGRVQAHDAGYVDFPASGARRHFINVAGIGFDAIVVEHMPSRKLGWLAYLVGLLRSLGSLSPIPLRIAVDGRTEHADALVLFACIGRYCGGAMFVAPRARSDDGKLDLTLIRHMPRLSILRSLPRLFDGSIAAHPRVTMWQTGAARIDAPAGTPLEADGEFIGHAPAAFGVLPGALRVMLP
ncbi:MAG: diacylglycerol kinase family lipid kinase [Rhodocyclales bacterium]|nr:diacylglycerol kinase family lipid kinase [Rhodocyclales bacterium]